MTTLGQRYKAAEQKRDEEYNGKPPFPKDIFKTHNQPEEINALTALRESLVRVVAKAKLDFIRGIEANIHGPDFLPVATYIPSSEGCYEFLKLGAHNEAGLRFRGAVSSTQKVLDDIWNPFLEWAEAEGLHLHLSGVGEAFGVRHFLVMTVFTGALTD